MNNKSEKQTVVCIICGETFNEIGNNPEPVYIGKGDRCCDECNNNKVIPARLKQLNVK